MRRTSRRRTSKHLARNARSFASAVSPIHYPDRDTGMVKRFSLIDSDAGPPSEREMYFVDQMVGPLGKRKTKLSGAAAGTISFIDYIEYGPPKSVYIQYMRTRSDQRGKGTAKGLLDAFLAKLREDGVTHLNFGKIQHPSVWKWYQNLSTAYERGDSKISVSGKHDL